MQLQTVWQARRKARCDLPSTDQAPMAGTGTTMPPRTLFYSHAK
jgi:hypothetical protein